MVQYGFYSTPFGLVKIGSEAGSIVLIRRVSAPDGASCPSPVTDLAARQLEEYFAGRRKAFDFPISPKGTPFQLAVLNALRQIPYGETRSYKEIAAAIGKPNAARAVGMACNRNPIWIAIPCHQVVGSDQTLTGYAGGLDMKQALLELEQKNR